MAESKDTIESPRDVMDHATAARLALRMVAHDYPETTDSLKPVMDQLERLADAMQSNRHYVPPINGKAIAFTGIGTTSTPYRTAAGLPLEGGLEEAHLLIEGLQGALRQVADDVENSDGDPSPVWLCRHAAASAGAILQGLRAGLAEHPLSAERDGYHMHADDPEGIAMRKGKSCGEACNG